MQYQNYEDIVAQLRSAGLDLASVKKSHGGALVGELYVGSVRSVRCNVIDERKRMTGAYRLHELNIDGVLWLTGCYWVDHGNSSFKLELRRECAKCGADMPLKASECPACKSKKSKARAIPEAQLAAHKAAMEAARREAEAAAEADAERAAAWANAVWMKCREAGPDDHDYIGRKNLKSAHGARLFENHDGVLLDGADKEDYEYLARFHGSLVVPMLDKAGNRRALQFILSRERHKDLISRRDGRDKEYWPRGMLKEGLHYVIGGEMHGVGLVAEGFATAGSLHEASNLPVAVAFDAGNMRAVGEIKYRQAKKRLKLLYCGDDDWLQHCRECKKPTPVAESACRHCGKPHGKGNAGMMYSMEAAAATAGAWVLPKFSAPRPDSRKGISDFNDLRCMEGEQAVGTQIQEKLAELEWLTPAAGMVALPIQQGGGDGRLPALSVMSLDDAVGRFIPLDDGTGKYLFDTRTSRVVHKDQMLALLPAGVRADDVKRHPLWQSRGAYYLDQVGFDPAGDDKSVKLNTWKGWPIEPREGRCGELLTLISYLCSGESSEKASEINLWLLRWMAYPLQHPGAKMASAVIMHGPQGTGKSTAFEVLAKIYGKGHSNPQMNYSVWLDQKALQDNFNADWENKLFVLAEEVVNGSDKWQLKNELKAVVSSETIRIRKVFTDGYPAKNRVNLVFLSNEDQPLPIENDDRRHLVIYTPPQLEEAFYDRVFYEIENGGIEAFYHYLMNLDLGDFHPKKKPPMTEAKQDLIWLSMPSEKRFMRSWIAGDLDLPFCPCLGNHLYIAYRKYCEQEGETRPRNRTQFISMLGKGEFSAWRAGQSVPVRESMLPNARTKNRKMVIPPDEVMQQVSLRIGPGETNYAKRPDDPQALWLCEGYLAFKDAAGIKDEDD